MTFADILSAAMKSGSKKLDLSKGGLRVDEDIRAFTSAANEGRLQHIEDMNMCRNNLTAAEMKAIAGVFPKL